MTGLERADESTVDADLDTLKEGEVSGIAPDMKLVIKRSFEINIWRHLWKLMNITYTLQALQIVQPT